MRELILYTTVSLDGYLAPIYGGFDMLATISNPEREDYGKNVFFDSIDTIIMGGNTYYELSCIDVEMPFKSKEIYVVSQKSLELHKEVRFIKENAITEIKKLKELDGKNIWVLGGGVLTASLLEYKLIDKMILNLSACHVGQRNSVISQVQWKVQLEINQQPIFQEWYFTG